MKRTTRKLFVAAAALGLAAASTIGSTYAWFTINGQADATNLEMKVTTGTAITVKKVADSNFTTELDLTNDFLTGDPAALIQHTAVTPMDASTCADFKAINVAKSNANNAYTFDTTGTGDAETTKSYADQVYTVDLDVKVSAGSKIGIAATMTSAAHVGTCKAEEVLRIAVITYSTGKTTGTASATIYRLVASTTGETDTATALYNATYGTTITKNTKDSCDLLTAANSKFAPKATADGSYVTEQITIKVWYEGSDYGCSNDIFTQSVAFGLTFTAEA